MTPEWLRSPELNLDDALITLDAEGLVVALNEEADRLALDGDPHGKPLEMSFPIRDEFSGQPPGPLTRSVVLPSRSGELRAFDLLVVPHGRGRGWTMVLRPSIASGDVEHEAWANLSRTSREGTGIGDPRTGTIGLVSGTFAALYGYTPAEMLGQHLGVLFADDGEGLRRSEEHIQNGAISWEAEHRRKDGSVFPVLMSMITVRDPLGQARFRALRVEDITERKGAEQREQAQRQLVERVIAAVPSVVYLAYLDGRGLRLLSREAAVALGYPAGTNPEPGTEGSDFRFNGEALHPDDRAAMRAHRERLSHLPDGEIAAIEYRLRNAAGGWTWFVSRDTVFERDAGGRVETIIGTATDITETKEAEITLRESEDRQAFLLRLNDATRTQVDASEIQMTVSRLLGEVLDADRVYFGDIDEERGVGNAWPGYLRGDTPSVAGLHPTETFPEVYEALRLGKAFTVSNAPSCKVLSASTKATYAAVGMAAFASVSLVIRQRVLWTLNATSGSPRSWSERDLGLMRETLERTWDVVERARAESALRESEEKYRSLFESIDEGYCVIEMIHDSEGEPVDYRFLQINPAFLKQTGLPPDIAGRRMREIAPTHEEFWFQTYERVAKTGESVRFEHEAVALGRWFDVYALNVGGTRVGILFTDITGRRRAEAVLRESEERLAAIFETSPIGICVMDSGGTIVLANHEVHRFLPTGVMPSLDSVRGERWEARDADGILLERSLFPGARALRGERVVPGIEMCYTEDDGTEIWTRVAAVPLQSAEGSVTGAFVTITDIDALKRTTEGLAKGERRLRTMIENLPGGAAFIVDHSLRYVLAEGEALAEAGFRPGDLVGRTVAETMPPPLVPEHETRYRRALAGVPFTTEHEAHGRSYVSRGTPLRSANGDIDSVLVVSYDISDRKQAEETLRKSREEIDRQIRLFDTTLSSLPDHVYALDPTGRYRYANAALLSYWGFSMEGVRGCTPLELGHAPDLAAQISEAIDRAIATKVPVSGIFYDPSRTEREREYEYVLSPFVDSDGAVNLLVGWSRDVTERRRAQTEQQAWADRLETRVAERTAALSESEERYRALIEAFAQTVWTTDASGRVVEDSPSWRAFTGQSLDDWMGYGWVDAVHPDDREFALRNWRESVERNVPVHTEFRLWHAASETWRRTRIHAQPLREPDGTLRGWAGMNTDLGA